MVFQELLFNANMFEIEIESNLQSRQLIILISAVAASMIRLLLFLNKNQWQSEQLNNAFHLEYQTCSLLSTCLWIELETLTLKGILGLCKSLLKLQLDFCSAGLALISLSQHWTVKIISFSHLPLLTCFKAPYQPFLAIIRRQSGILKISLITF